MVDTKIAVWVSTGEKTVLRKNSENFLKFGVVLALALYKNPAVILLEAQGRSRERFAKHSVICSSELF